jgi:hypothetical protein
LALSSRFSETQVGADGQAGKPSSGAQPSQPLEETPAFLDNSGSGSVCTSGGGPGLQNQLSVSTTFEQNSTSVIPEKNLAFCLALLKQISLDLALVVERWEILPKAIRAGIMAMVNVAGGK